MRIHVDREFRLLATNFTEHQHTMFPCSQQPTLPGFPFILQPPVMSQVCAPPSPFQITVSSKYGQPPGYGSDPVLLPEVHEGPSPMYILYGGIRFGSVPYDHTCHMPPCFFLGLWPAVVGNSFLLSPLCGPPSPMHPSQFILVSHLPCGYGCCSGWSLSSCLASCRPSVASKHQLQMKHTPPYGQQPQPALPAGGM